MEPTATPLVSVIVRSMDRPELSDAIASLAGQTCPRLEILVVDATGGRHRPLPNVALHSGHSIRLVSAGRALNRPQAANVGIDAVAGEFFSFLDDDDRCDPDHIALLLAAADAHRDKLVVYGRANLVTPDGVVQRRLGARFNRALMHFGPLFYWQAALFRTRVRDLGCRVDETLEICEDRDFLAQIAEHSDFAFVEAATLRYRADLGTSGTGSGANQDDGRRLQFDSLLRARWAGPRAYHGERVTRWCRRAVDAYKRGDLDEARRWFEHTLAQYPDDPNALHGLGRVLFDFGDLKEAAANVRRATEITETVPEYRWTMALILEAQGDFEGAAAAAIVAMTDPRFAREAEALHVRLQRPFEPSAAAPANRSGRLVSCACGSGLKFKQCCGRLETWTAPPIADPRIVSALGDYARGQAGTALQSLQSLNADEVCDAASGARIAAMYARLDMGERAVAFARRAVALTDDVESRRLLTRYCDSLYRSTTADSARKTALALLAQSAFRKAPRPTRRIHIVSTMATVGGTENRALELYALLAPHADVTLWSVTPPHAAHAACATIREIGTHPDDTPTGGMAIFVGCYFDYGDWLHRATFDRIVIAHNIDLPVELVQRLTQIREGAPSVPIDLTFPSARFARHAGLPGAVEVPFIDLQRFVPHARMSSGSTLVIGRHSRDDPSKHHPNDPSLYRRLVGLGHRVRLLGGTFLGRALEGDAARPAIELLPAGAEPAPAFLASLDCFLYRKSPDWYETGGTAILEAMGTGLPVVVFDDCGAADWIDSDRTGFVVNSEDEALAAIARLANEPALRERIGVAARAQAIELVDRQRQLARAFYLGDDAVGGAPRPMDGSRSEGIAPLRIG
ncbi:MAG TPA: glycosyltransferase [Casimicrobiaceae bacterium]